MGEVHARPTSIDGGARVGDQDAASRVRRRPRRPPCGSSRRREPRCASFTPTSCACSRAPRPRTALALSGDGAARRRAARGVHGRTEVAFRSSRPCPSCRASSRRARSGARPGDRPPRSEARQRPPDARRRRDVRGEGPRLRDREGHGRRRRHGRAHPDGRPPRDPRAVHEPRKQARSARDVDQRSGPPSGAAVSALLRNAHGSPGVPGADRVRASRRAPVSLRTRAGREGRSGPRALSGFFERAAKEGSQTRASSTAGEMARALVRRPCPERSGRVSGPPIPLSRLPDVASIFGPPGDPSPTLGESCVVGRAVAREREARRQVVPPTLGARCSSTSPARRAARSRAPRRPRSSSLPSTSSLAPPEGVVRRDPPLQRRPRAASGRRAAGGSCSVANLVADPRPDRPWWQDSSSAGLRATVKPVLDQVSPSAEVPRCGEGSRSTRSRTHARTTPRAQRASRITSIDPQLPRSVPQWHAQGLGADAQLPWASCSHPTTWATTCGAPSSRGSTTSSSRSISFPMASPTIWGLDDAFVLRVAQPSAAEAPPEAEEGIVQRLTDDARGEGLPRRRLHPRLEAYVKALRKGAASRAHGRGDRDRRGADPRPVPPGSPRLVGGRSGAELHSRTRRRS